MAKSIIAIAALSGAALLAQDITGSWQGALQAGIEGGRRSSSNQG